MEVEILKLVYEYSIKNKLIDQDFIYKLIDIVVRNRRLESYIEKIDFRSNLSDDEKYITLASYVPFTKNLLIDLEKFEVVFELNRKYEDLFTPIEVAIFRNLSCVAYILHEMEHAYQMKLADNPQDISIEAVLSRVCSIMHQTLLNKEFIELIYSGQITEEDIKERIVRYKEYYNKYYKFNPIERLAQIKSFNTVRNIIKPLKSVSNELYDYFEASVYEEMLKSYSELLNQDICPTCFYLDNTEHGDVWREFEFYRPNKQDLIKNVSEQYDLTRRLAYGLPITHDEYNKTSARMKSMNKFRV